MTTTTDRQWLIQQLRDNADRMSIICLEAGAPFSINAWRVGSDLFVGPAALDNIEKVVRVRPAAQPAVIQDVFHRAISADRVIVRARNGGDEMEFVAVRSDSGWTVTDGDEPARDGGTVDLWCAIVRAWQLPDGDEDG